MHISYLVHDQYQILHLWIEIYELLIIMYLLHDRMGIIFSGEITMDLLIREIYLHELPRLYGMMLMRLIDIMEVHSL